MPRKKKPTPIDIIEKESSNNQKIELTETQKAELLSFYQKHKHDDSPPSLKDYVNVAFPGLNLDTRFKHGKVVKEFLHSLSIKPRTNVHVKVGEYELSLAEKEFIENNAKDMKIMEIAKTLFPNEKITPLSKQVRAIIKFVKDNNIVSYEGEAEHFNDDEFQPPSTYTACFRLINKYTHDTLDFQQASEKDKQGVYSLIKYLHSPRFLQMINAYTDERNRELFLSEFVRSCYNKPDLTAEELNLYLNLCSDFVLGATIQSQIEILNNRLNNIADDPDGKLSMALAETISSKTTEYDKCLQRQKNLITTLNGDRAKRLEKLQSGSQSISSLVEFFREEKNRKKMLALTKKREEALDGLRKDFETMDSLKVEIFGSV